jgi:hypothetical protein
MPDEPTKIITLSTVVIVSRLLLGFATRSHGRCKESVRGTTKKRRMAAAV